MASALLVKDMLEAQDAGFLPAFLALGAVGDRERKHDESAALSLLKPWLSDTRPWARAQLLAYVDDGCARPGHRRFVRALLRHAEGASASHGDDELLGALVAAFDRMLPTQVRVRTRFDWQTRETVRRSVRRLVVRVPFRARQVVRKWTREGLKKTGEIKEVDTRGQFSVVTRRYLQRRAVRALRRLARQPDRYVRAATSLLLRTPAARVADPAGLLDARGLCAVLYRHSDVLDLKPHQVSVRAGRRVAELTFAPMAEDAWAEHGVSAESDALLRIVAEAPAAVARRFAAHELRRISPELPVTRLRALFRSPHDEARAAALMLLAVADTRDVSAQAWIDLLEVEDPALAAELAARAASVLATASLSAETLVALCRARAAPVALLAARLLVERMKEIGVRAALPALDAEVPAARALVLDAIVRPLVDSRDALLVRELLDSPFADVRARGAALVRKEAAFMDAEALWTALVESPFADLRGVLLAHLEERRDAIGPDKLLGACAAALLDCQRGSRQRARAVRFAAEELARALVHAPDDAARAAPLLVIAMRSLRPSDRRATVAAVVRAGWHVPALRGTTIRLLGVAAPDSKDLEVQA